MIELLLALPPLYLDKGDYPAAAGDQVDLSGRSLHALVEYLPALRPQPERRLRLARPATELGLLPLHSDLISIARA